LNSCKDRTSRRYADEFRHSSRPPGTGQETERSRKCYQSALKEALFHIIALPCPRPAHSYASTRKQASNERGDKVAAPRDHEGKARVATNDSVAFSDLMKFLNRDCGAHATTPSLSAAEMRVNSVAWRRNSRDRFLQSGSRGAACGTPARRFVRGFVETQEDCGRACAPATEMRDHDRGGVP